jgi:hypothetical protein
MVIPLSQLAMFEKNILNRKKNVILKKKSDFKTINHSIFSIQPMLEPHRRFAIAEFHLPASPSWQSYKAHF